MLCFNCFGNWNDSILREIVVLIVGNGDRYWKCFGGGIGLGFENVVVGV